MRSFAHWSEHWVQSYAIINRWSISSSSRPKYDRVKKLSTNEDAIQYDNYRRIINCFYKIMLIAFDIWKEVNNICTQSK